MARQQPFATLKYRTHRRGIFYFLSVLFHALTNIGNQDYPVMIAAAALMENTRTPANITMHRELKVSNKNVAKINMQRTHFIRFFPIIESRMTALGAIYQVCIWCIYIIMTSDATVQL